LKKEGGGADGNGVPQGRGQRRKDQGGRKHFSRRGKRSQKNFLALTRGQGRGGKKRESRESLRRRKWEGDLQKGGEETNLENANTPTEMDREKNENRAYSLLSGER